MTTPKKTDKNTPPQKFEVEQGADNNNIPTENAVMADNEVPNDETEVEFERKGLNLYIDPEGKKTTSIGFVLADKQITLQTIDDRFAELDKIVINGFLDKKNYDLVKKAKSEFMKTRTTLNKVAKTDVIDPINDWVKNYKAELGEISDRLKGYEDKFGVKLTEQEEALEKEQERIEKEQQARIQGRVSGLFNLGAVFNEEEGFYTFPYNGALIINSVQLKQWEDEEYGTFIDDVVESWNIDQARIRQEEQEAEQEKLRILNLAQEQEAQKTALADKMIKLRHKELKLAGAEFVGDQWMVRGEAIDPDWITGFDDGRWDDLIAEIENPLVPESLPEGLADSVGNETTAEEAVASFSGTQSPIHEAHTAQTSGFEIEGTETQHQDDVDADPQLDDAVTDIEFEEAETSKSFWFNYNFTAEDPFINHHFKSTTMRIFPEEFEMEANEGVTPAELMDAGILGRTELKYILIKRPK